MTSTEGTPLSAAHTDGVHPLAPYLPRLTIEWITSRPEDRYREERGTVAFVDISGFTKLSEGLARHGKVGAEELTATIGTCFVALLDLAVSFGGRLLKFGGDALLLYFYGEEHEARACRAAAEMRRALRVVGRLTVLGQKVSLRMSVGVHSGVFHFFLVGESHRELVVTGAAASTTVTMEGTADAGEIVISEATARALRPGVVGEAKGPGFLLRRPPTVPEDSFLAFEPVDPDVDLWGAIPVGLREVLASVQKDSEHRRVTLAFIHFDGTDKLIEDVGPAETANQIETLLVAVQRAVDRHEVAFLATDVDRDGGKVILTSGAPSSSGEDEHRMLLAVRDIMDSGIPLAIRIGVNRGSVFVGEIGPHYRRTFTVMGDAVNLAARLMAKAQPGQIITAPEVLERSRTVFEAEELEPFYVKGKAKPVRALSLGANTGSRSLGLETDLPMVGRDAEVLVLEELVARAREGHGALVEIVGEPGVGKSRLVERLEAIAADVTHLSAQCERYESSTPYRVVRGLLRPLLGLPDEGSDQAIADRFVAELTSSAPSLLPWAPLIATAIDLSLPETPETSELEEEFQRPRLAEVLFELLALLLPASGVLVVEDAHFMDEASADLFRYLATSIEDTSWLFCVTRRDVESGFVASTEFATSIALGPLDVRASTQLAEVATQEAPLSPHDIEQLVDRSDGNPLFLRELIAAAMNGDSVDALPDSVEEVIAARIDRLSRDDRHLLRRLSVLGQSFSVDLLRDVVDELPDDTDPVWDRLDEFIARDAKGTVTFRNGLLRDSAYDGLTYRLRRELHTRAGDTILQAAKSRKEVQPELLSFHYLHAQRFREAWSYALEAAERAKAVYANFEAAEFYERALLAGRRLGDLGPSELSAVHEALADARNRAGGYAEAATSYRAARRLVGSDVVAEARLALKLARVQGWLDRYASALRWITKGLRLLEEAEGPEAAGQRAELLSWYGRFCQEAGHHARAIKWCSMAVDEAEACGAKEALADALRVIDWAKMDLGRLEHPDNWLRALALFEELDDLSGQAAVLSVLGGFAYFRGDWDEALEKYRRAQDTVRRTGNAVADAFDLLNIGEIALDQGRFDAAGEYFDSASRTWRAAGYRSGAAYVKCDQGRLAAARGRFEEAVVLFEESIAESRHVGSHADALEAQARLAECFVLSGDDASALSMADDALAQARNLGGVPPQIALLQRVRGVALARSGEREAAQEALEQSLSAAQKRKAEYEVALTTRVMAECDIDLSELRRTKLRRAASSTLSKLGVVWTPDLVPPRAGSQDDRTGTGGPHPDRVTA